jgi:hypothetical protein
MEKQLDPIVTKLRERQGSLTDAEFAAVLGVSRPLWGMVKDGAVPVGLSLLAGVTRAFPEMGEDVLAAVERYQKPARATVAA